MTEPEQPAEGTEATEPKPRGGRPRAQATIDQDNTVLTHIPAAGTEGATRKQLEEATTLPPNKVYLSIWRLKSAGLIEKIAGNKWVQTAPANDEAPADVPVDAPVA
jgi:hypothetical protein